MAMNITRDIESFLGGLIGALVFVYLIPIFSQAASDAQSNLTGANAAIVGLFVFIFIVGGLVYIARTFLK